MGAGSLSQSRTGGGDTSQTTKIAVLGATGRTGIKFVWLALQQGYAIRGICRNPSRPLVQELLAQHSTTGRLEFVEADVFNSKGDLEKAISGCDAVFSFLEFSREFGGCFDPVGGRGYNPCLCTPAQRRNPRYVQWAKDLCDALKHEGIERLVLQSTWFSQSTWYNPAKLFETLNCGMICMFRVGCGAGMWNGFQMIEDEMKRSSLNYTIVHCPILDQQRPNVQTKRGFEVAMGTDQMLICPFIVPPGCPYLVGAQRTYPDVARFFVDNVNNFHRQSVAFV